MATVSVVIPTTGRESLSVAVKTVLAQTYPPHEVLVVADTSDPVDLPDDRRVRLLRVGPRAGGNVARMAGVNSATGEYIAFLDDDDTWRPDKLARQLESVAHLSGDVMWLASSFVERSSGGIWPTREIADGEDLVDYLFRKRSLKGGQGALHTSTLLFPKALIEMVPLDQSLRFHQDTTWLIDLAAAEPALVVVQPPIPLVDVRDEGAGSVSGSITADDSVAWARKHMGAVSRRTRGDFLTTVSTFYAWRRNDPRAALRVAVAAFQVGPPSPYGATSLVTTPLKVFVARARAAAGRARG